jgi:ADP-ribosylation factor-binding protein GGA
MGTMPKHYFLGLSDDPSALRKAIWNACNQNSRSSNSSLNHKVTSLINEQKGTAPREAALDIVRLIHNKENRRSTTEMALDLLDACVKHCGYPFHLQIATPEFLDQYVKKFPKLPPDHIFMTEQRMIENIEKWRLAVCEKSKYPEDLE